MSSDSEIELLTPSEASKSVEEIMCTKIEISTPSEASKGVGDIMCMNLTPEIPETSKEKYLSVYNLFMQWHKDQKTTYLDENILMDYFQGLGEKFKPSTLWATYSMLRTTLSIHNNVDISKYMKLRAFLKRKATGYRPKKSRIFTPEEINRFIKEAPETDYLLAKVILIMGIMGACRKDELYQMKVTDFKDFGTAVLVEVPSKKANIARRFTLTGRSYEIFKRYLNLRPPNVTQPCFFLNYQKGKCTVQRIGTNKFGSMGKIIATYLKLPHPEQYTGHCFRRSSATLLVDSGEDITFLRREGVPVMPTNRLTFWQDQLKVAMQKPPNTEASSSNITLSPPSTFAYSTPTHTTSNPTTESSITLTAPPEFANSGSEDPLGSVQVKIEEDELPLLEDTSVRNPLDNYVDHSEMVVVNSHQAQEHKQPNHHIPTCNETIVNFDNHVETAEASKSAGDSNCSTIDQQYETKDLDLEERWLKLEERKLLLEERRFELEAIERKQRLELEKERFHMESVDRERLAKVIDAQQTIINRLLNKK